MAALRFQFPQQALAEARHHRHLCRRAPDHRQRPRRPVARRRAITRYGLDDGLLTVTGGKLTTFRAIALDVAEARQAAAARLARRARAAAAVRRAARRCARIGMSRASRSNGCWGAMARTRRRCWPPRRAGELDTIAGTETLWAELRWAARAEAVVRLEDLLLRRTRLGLQLRGGGAGMMDRDPRHLPAGTRLVRCTLGFRARPHIWHYGTRTTACRRSRTDTR